MRISTSKQAVRDLHALKRIVQDFGPDAAALKVDLMRRLERASLRTSAQVLLLHETLLFARAYPDDERVLAHSERLLRSFARRADLRRVRAELDNSGIAGTSIRYRFYPPTASWLARLHGPHLAIDWDEFEHADLLERNLWMLVLWGESAAFEGDPVSMREWIRRLKGPRESDAAFLVRRIEALPMHVFARERFAEELDVPLVLSPGPRTPSRTLARSPVATPVYQREPLRRGRPDLESDVLRAPLAIRAVSAREGARLVHMAREAMVTRSRDLEAFMHADARDVRMIDCGDGLAFACMGVRPERRLLLESVYGFLTLKNGVPIGYVLASALFGSAEIAYNVFDAFRGAEAAHVYGRALAAVRALFGVDTFTVYPYQLGHENEEGLRSGAWWFYQKLGFRPRDAGTLHVMKRELARIARRPEHRSSLATLRVLAQENVFFDLSRARDDVIGVFPLDRVGAHVAARMAERFGSDREQATRTCTEEARKALGIRLATLNRDERMMLDRWSPLLACIPGVARWPASDRRALVAVIRAKAGQRESEYVKQIDAHARLRAALRQLVTSSPW
jgi:hypothetical protein